MNSTKASIMLVSLLASVPGCVEHEPGVDDAAEAESGTAETGPSETGPSETGPSETDSDGDPGDDDRNPGGGSGDGGAELCDLDGLPEYTFTWLTMPYTGLDLVNILPSKVVAGGGALFVSGAQDAEQGFLARHDQDASLEWLVSHEREPATWGSLNWDGEHLYIGRGEVVRVDGDGNVDDWSVGLEFADVDRIHARGPKLAMIGTRSDPPAHPKETAYSDAIYAVYDKSDPTSQIWAQFGEPERDERGRYIEALDSGAYLAVINVEGTTLNLLGLDGSAIELALWYQGWSNNGVERVLERPGGLLLGGWSRTSSASETWLSLIGLDGVEQWHVPIGPCDPNSLPLPVAILRGPDRLWFVMNAKVGPNSGDLAAFIVEVDLDGNELDTRRVTIPGEASTVVSADYDDGALFMVGRIIGATRGWLARVDP